MPVASVPPDGAAVNEIVGGVVALYPLLSVSIPTSITLPPYPSLAVAAAAPLLNVTVGTLVYHNPCSVTSMLVTLPAVMVVPTLAELTYLKLVAEVPSQKYIRSVSCAK